MNRRPGKEPFSLTGGSGQVIRGESVGSGRDLVLLHGLSATRRYVLHGSLFLPRHGYRVVTYDARGHGESDPAPDGYRYPELAADLDRVVAGTTDGGGQGGLLLGGHSMGCHTAAAWALENPDRVAALILAGPVYIGQKEGARELARWDARAAALERGGPEGFAAEMTRGAAPGETRDRMYHLARDRAALHRNPKAVARALRELPRSRPFGELSALAGIAVPVLVVGTRDELDPTHPLRAAEIWAETIPAAEFVVEDRGDPPLTWQGGKLSRGIADFLARHGHPGATV